MRIQLLDNGIDSLQRGFKSFLDFEQATLNKPPSLADYLLLKNAVLSTHHGVEILMKYIISQKSEFLIISKMDNNYMEAYKEKEKQNFASVFETSRSSDIHTITYAEALERVTCFSSGSFSKSFRTKLESLNNIRNSLTHAEISILDTEILDVFDNLLNDLDIFFFNAIGNDYTTLSGYSDMSKNYNQYMSILSEKGMDLKKDTITVLKDAIDKAGLSIGEGETKLIVDINQAKNIINSLKKSDLKLGMDMYNGYCSGIIKISIVDSDHFCIDAIDNRAKYIFKFKSMLLHFPPITNNKSPIIIFESDDDMLYDSQYSNIIEIDSVGGRCLEGIEFLEEPQRITYDIEEINKFYARMDYDESFVIPQYYNIRNFLSQKIFACINIQGLGYWNFRGLLNAAKCMDGRQLEIELRK
ncbi:hypothetical protein [Lacrimispora sp.]|uniref:hypothetical protein n=1 Tax=Lacrimispora sp. TaxID=2719234 RepID=UPI0028A7F0BF|nr:hypothetical protein [Lacrimispora sp.]